MIHAALSAVLVAAALPLFAEKSLLNAPAPAFDLPSLSGQRLSLEDLRGRIVVLHFGAGW